MLTSTLIRTSIKVKFHKLGSMRLYTCSQLACHVCYVCVYSCSLLYSSILFLFNGTMLWRYKMFRQINISPGLTEEGDKRNNMLLLCRSAQGKYSLCFAHAIGEHFAYPCAKECTCFARAIWELFALLEAYETILVRLSKREHFLSLEPWSARA